MCFVERNGRWSGMSSRARHAALAVRNASRRRAGREGRRAPRSSGACARCARRAPHSNTGGSHAAANAYLVTFIAVVVISLFLCSVYLALIASNQYVAEARFAVQSAQFGFSSETNGTLGALSAGAIPALAGQDAYIITDYIRRCHHRRSRGQDRHQGDFSAARG